MYIGFSHSEILGSKLIYQLPEAYRRLLRPSSAPIAKASTVCSLKLDTLFFSLTWINPDQMLCVHYVVLKLRAVSVHPVSRLQRAKRP